MAEALAFQSYPYEINHRPYNLFYRDHRELFTDVEPMAKVGVITEWPKRSPHYLQPLGMHNILYEVIAASKWTRDVLGRYEVILLPDLEGVGSELCDALAAFEADGGTVIATGKSMLYDEFGRRRRCGRQAKPETITASSRLRPEIIERTRRASNPQYVEVCGPPHVVVNLVRKRDDSGDILHVINYGRPGCGPVNIKVNIPGRAAAEATVFTPDGQPPATNVPAPSSLTLDRLDVYSIVVFRRSC